MALELWHEWNSVHSYKVRMVLAAKGLAWTSQPLALLRFEHTLPAYLAINPEGVVPTLVHDGRALYDASPICEYLDEVFRETPLRPVDALGRLHMRRWLKFHDDVAHAAVRDASFELLYKPVLAAMPRAELDILVARHPLPERRRKFIEGAHPSIDQAKLTTSLLAARAVAARIDATLHAQAAPERQGWLLGAAFTLADIAMAPFAERIANLGCGFVWDGLPAGAAWSARVLAQASVQQARPPEKERLPVPTDAIRAEAKHTLVNDPRYPSPAKPNPQ